VQSNRELELCKFDQVPLGPRQWDVFVAATKSLHLDLGAGKQLSQHLRAWVVF
jgi:hypothetical protein